MGFPGMECPCLQVPLGQQHPDTSVQSGELSVEVTWLGGDALQASPPGNSVWLAPALKPILP